MPSTLPLSGARIPLGGEANNAASFMSAFGADIDPHLVLWATSTSDRDSKYGGTATPVKTLVASNEAKCLWMKIATTGTNQWFTVANDSGWVNTGFAYPSVDWAAGGYQKVRNVGGTVEVRAVVTYTGSGVTANATNGNLTDTAVLVVPSAFTPDTSLSLNARFSSGVSAGAYMESNGTCWVTDTSAGLSISTGLNLYITGTWLL